MRYKKFIFLTGLILAISGGLTAQDSPTFLFDKGVGVVAPDSILSLHFQINLQNRIDLTTISTDDWSVDEFKARIRRFRLKFGGFLINPKLTYKVQLALAPGSVKSATADQAPQVMLDAMIFYKINPRLKLGIGQGKVPGDREFMNSSAALQLVDRSLYNSVFNANRDFGLQVEYEFNPSAARPVVFHGAITTGEGRNWIKSEGTGLSYTGRLDWYPLGMFKTAYKEGDLEWQLKPRLMVGIAYNFNVNALRSSGQRGSLLYKNRDISTLYADMTYKHQGWAAQFAYSYRSTDEPVTVNPGGNGIRYVYEGSGYNIQLSKYFHSHWEVVGRWSGALPGEAINDLEPQKREWTFGLNRYLKGRSVKLQADASLHHTRALNSDFAGKLGFRFQAQVGF